MPKRIATPPPGDDEPRYLTVVYPYAISGTCNMELPKDRQDFARWVACCIDMDAFYAIYHKPSSRAMVIIEVGKDYPHFDRILGEHRWKDFLRNPTKEDEDRVTQVFYCTYNTGRTVQKNGWKRIDVDEAWFKRPWSPNNKQITYPYPETHFCAVPVEDRTNHPLCRPLPGAVIAPPPPEIVAPQPVVGSAEWIKKKDGGSSLAPITTQSKPSALSAWGKGAPKAQATSAKPYPTTNAHVKKTVGIPQGPPPATRKPAIGGGPIAVKSSDVWHNTGTKPASARPATNWDESLPVSRQGTPMSPPATTTNQVPAAPPGLPARKNAWGSSAAHPTDLPGLTVPAKATASVGQGVPDRITNLNAASWGSAGASTSSPDSDSGPDLTTATESDNPHTVYVHFSESMEEEFHGMRIRAIEDEGELRELDSIAPGTWGEPMGTATWETGNAGYWDDDPADAEDLWKRNQETVKPTLCNAHGIICKKGICAEYAKQLRLAKRAEEADKRKAAFANKGKKGGRLKARGGAKKNDENEPTNQNAAQSNPFRGPGAPVKTNWRGAPRAIVDADAIEKRDAAKALSDDGWGNSDPECEPNAAAVTAAGPPDAMSNASWDVSEDAFDPWATPAQAVPAPKTNHAGGKPQDKKKPGQAKAATSWADQVDAELAAGAGGNDSSAFSVVSSKRGSKRGTSTTGSGWGTNAPKSSTSGWGSVSDMPW